MKSLKVAFAVFLLLTPGYLFADCPEVLGPYYMSGYSWYQYEFGLECGQKSSSTVQDDAMWCYNEPAHRVANVSGTHTVTYYYTIPTTDNDWEISFLVEFNNGGDGNNFSRGDFTVTRSGSTITSGNIWYSNSALSCTRESYWPFSANAGDLLTITVQMKANGSSAYAETSAPDLFRGI